MKRWGNELDHVVSVRFSPEVNKAVREIASREDVTVSSWIRRLIDREIAPPETVDFTFDEGSTVQLPADAVQAITAKLMPFLWQGRSVSLTFGPVDEKHRREAAQATTAEVVGGRPLGLVPGSGRLGAPRSLTSSLNTNGGQGRTFSCQHMSIGNVVSAECWICGPLAAAA